MSSRRAEGGDWGEEIFARLLTAPACPPKPLIDTVDKILAITSNPGYDPKNPPEEQKKLESQINQLVYKLYELTEDEIKTVEDVRK